MSHYLTKGENDKNGSQVKANLRKFCQEKENENDNQKSGRAVSALPSARRLGPLADASPAVAHVPVEGHDPHVAAARCLHSGCCGGGGNALLDNSRVDVL